MRLLLLLFITSFYAIFYAAAACPGFRWCANCRIRIFCLRDGYVFSFSSTRMIKPLNYRQWPLPFGFVCISHYIGAATLEP